MESSLNDLNNSSNAVSVLKIEYGNAMFVLLSRLTAICLLCATGTVLAAPLFPDDVNQAQTLEIGLDVDLKAVMRSDAEEQPGELTLKTPQGVQTFSVKVSPRGKSRQQRCKFFPLWINFKKSEVENTIFAGQNKLKLVTHCSTSLSGKGYVPAEMLVYRLLNLLTDASFRVRAVNMTYADQSNQRPAFFIEHKKNLAKRLGGTIVDEVNPKRSELDPATSARVALFQYMVGNTDFSFVQGPDPEECCHNAVPIRKDNTVLSVPYDFDVTGFVNVPYAGPVPSLGIKKLTQRLYRGYCDHNAHLDEEIRYFKDHRDALFSAVTNFNDLEGLRTKRLVSFLEGFYKVIDSERSTQSRILKKCR